MSDALKNLFPYAPTHVPHDLDLLKLFDTTADLSGGDIDIADWVRGGDELDVYVFWRDQDANQDPYKKLKPRHEELCPVSIGDFKKNWKTIAGRKDAAIWRQVYNKGWEKLAEEDLIYPGQVFLLNQQCGGYSTTEGWKADSKNEVTPVPEPSKSTTPPNREPTGDDQGDEDAAEGTWQSIFTHSQKVWAALEAVLKDPTISSALTDDEKQSLLHTPPWHDYGKAHKKFFAKFNQDKRKRWENWVKFAKLENAGIWPAKAPGNRWKPNFSYKSDNEETDLNLKRRPGFRHELASALGLLELIRRADPGHLAVSLDAATIKELKVAAPHLFDEEEKEGKMKSENQKPVEMSKGLLDQINSLLALDTFTLDLLLYLIASHHGKVRMGLTSTEMDHETDPKKNPDPIDPANPARRTRGVQDGDKLPACRLPASHDGNSAFVTPEINLDLSLSEMFSTRYGRSWRERTSGLLAVLGPFRLAYLEALVRAADARGP